jgi:hypothetical protein
MSAGAHVLDTRRASLEPEADATCSRTEGPMPAENVATVRRLFEAFDAVDLGAMDELLTRDFIAHGLAPQFSEDRAGWTALAQHWAAGFSD